MMLPVVSTSIAIARKKELTSQNVLKRPKPPPLDKSSKQDQGEFDNRPTRDPGGPIKMWSAQVQDPDLEAGLRDKEQIIKSQRDTIQRM
jgi:hypothetical protein